jgi:hypothetical protein
VSSSDSRDTIIARSDDTKSSRTDSTTHTESTLIAEDDHHHHHQLQPKTEPKPKMIPVRVVHEDRPSGRSPSEFEPAEQPWGKRGRLLVHP